MPPKKVQEEEEIRGRFGKLQVFEYLIKRLGMVCIVSEDSIKGQYGLRIKTFSPGIRQWQVLPTGEAPWHQKQSEAG